MSSSIEDLLRELAPRVLGSVARRSGDFDAAEDAAQEAKVAAALHWPRDGTPLTPYAWLVQTATRRLIDQRRSERSRRSRKSLVAAVDEVSASGEVADQDDTLLVLFMCCHPALTPPSAIALTLRAVGGLTTSEIAQAFFLRVPLSIGPRHFETSGPETSFVRSPAMQHGSEVSHDGESSETAHGRNTAVLANFKGRRFGTARSSG